MPTDTQPTLAKTPWILAAAQEFPAECPQSADSRGYLLHAAAGAAVYASACILAVGSGHLSFGRFWLKRPELHFSRRR
jgi:hypothetical protein